LPLEAVAAFCLEHSIVLVVDGTQSCHLLLSDQKAVLDKVDFFVMSTHKWIGNVKTCGLIR
jgi:selenocysteine lyase/cysteine desulfurase